MEGPFFALRVDYGFSLCEAHAGDIVRMIRGHFGLATPPPPYKKVL